MAKFVGYFIPLALVIIFNDQAFAELQTPEPVKVNYRTCGFCIEARLRFAPRPVRAKYQVQLRLIKEPETGTTDHGCTVGVPKLPSTVQITFTTKSRVISDWYRTPRYNCIVENYPTVYAARYRFLRGKKIISRWSRSVTFKGSLSYSP